MRMAPYRTILLSLQRCTAIAAALNLMEDAIRSENALRQSEEKYRTLFNSTEQGFAIIELVRNDHNRCIDFRYLEANPSFEKLFDPKHTEIIGKTGFELFPALDRFGPSLSISPSSLANAWKNCNALRPVTKFIMHNQPIKL